MNNSKKKLTIDELILKGGRYFIARKDLDIKKMLEELIQDLLNLNKVNNLTQGNLLLQYKRKLEVLNRDCQEDYHYEKLFNDLMTLYLVDMAED